MSTEFYKVKGQVSSQSAAKNPFVQSAILEAPVVKCAAPSSKNIFSSDIQIFVVIDHFKTMDDQSHGTWNLWDTDLEEMFGMYIYNCSLKMK